TGCHGPVCVEHRRAQVTSGPRGLRPTAVLRCGDPDLVEDRTLCRLSGATTGLEPEGRPDGEAEHEEHPAEDGEHPPPRHRVARGSIEETGEPLHEGPDGASEEALLGA